MFIELTKNEYIKKEKAKRINKEFRKSFSTAIIAAAGFITALAWRDVLNEFFDEVLSLRPMQSNLIVALIITLLAVIVIMAISRINPKN